jgi:hypothetical protein
MEQKSQSRTKRLVILILFIIPSLVACAQSHDAAEPLTLASAPSSTATLYKSESMLCDGAPEPDINQTIEVEPDGLVRIRIHSPSGWDVIKTYRLAPNGFLNKIRMTCEQMWGSAQEPTACWRTNDFLYSDFEVATVAFSGNSMTLNRDHVAQSLGLRCTAIFKKR